METTEFCMVIAEQAINFVNDSCSFVWTAFYNLLFGRCLWAID